MPRSCCRRAVATNLTSSELCSGFSLAFNQGNTGPAGNSCKISKKTNIFVPKLMFCGDSLLADPNSLSTLSISSLQGRRCKDGPIPRALGAAGQSIAYQQSYCRTCRLPGARFGQRAGGYPEGF